MKSKINAVILMINLMLSVQLLSEKAAEHPLVENAEDEVQESVANMQTDYKSIWPTAVGITEDGKPIFTTLPLSRNLFNTGNPPKDPATTFVDIGDFVDLNGDSLLDFTVSYTEWNGAQEGSLITFRATFMNGGNGTWTMAACYSNINTWPILRFPSCG